MSAFTSDRNYTRGLGLYKPSLNEDAEETAWGERLNLNSDLIDDAITTLQRRADAQDATLGAVLQSLAFVRQQNEQLMQRLEELHERISTPPPAPVVVAQPDGRAEIARVGAMLGLPAPERLSRDEIVARRQQAAPPIETFNTTTPNFGLNMPEVGGDSNIWGGLLNDNAMTLDGLFGNYLPLSGGQLRGALNVPNGNFQNAGLGIGDVDGTGLSRSGNFLVFTTQTRFVLAMSDTAAQFYTPLSMLTNKITQVGNATAAGDALNMGTGDARYLALAGGQMAGAIELLPPVNPQDAVNKNYVDTTIAGLSLFVSTWQVAANTPDISGGAPSPGDYYIAVTAVPAVAETAPANIPGIGGQSVNNGDTVIWDAVGAVFELVRGGPLTVAEADAFYVQKTGDTMQGPLVLAADAAAPLQAVTLQQMQAAVAGDVPEAPTDGAVYGRQGSTASWLPALPLAGGTVTGQTTFSGSNPGLAIRGEPGTFRTLNFTSGAAPLGNRWQIQVNNVGETGSNAGSNLVINRFSDSGGSLGPNFTLTRSTGLLTLSGGLTVSAGAVAFSGGGVTVTLPANPTAALHAATKQYVDSPAANPLPYVRNGASWAAGTAFTNIAGDVAFDLDTITGTSPGPYTGYIGWHRIGAQSAGLNFPPGVAAGSFLTSYASSSGWCVQLGLVFGGLQYRWMSTQGNYVPWQKVITDAGGTLTGALILAADPTTALQAVTKQYVDANAGGIADAPSDGTAYGRLNAAWTQVLPLTGGALSADLTVDGAVSTTGGYRISLSNSYWFSDAAGTYLGFDAANWRLQYNRGTGGLSYLRGDDNATLFSIDPGGSITAAGVVQGGGQVRSNNGRLMSVAPGYAPTFTSWDTSLGQAVAFWCEAAEFRIGAADGGGAPTAAWAGINAASLGHYSADVSYTCNGFANAVMWGNYNNFNVPGTAWKPGGGAWADGSDARIKTVVGDYTPGLDAILALHPVRYTFNGNWITVDGTPRTSGGVISPHAQPAKEAIEYIGLVAQEAELSMPEMVTKTSAIIDGELVDDMRVLDASALTYALVNAVQEINARLVARGI